MTTQQQLDERYGRTGGRRGRWIIAIFVAAALVGTAAFGWLTVSNSLSAVDVDTTGFEIADERTVIISFQVGAPIGSTVACALEAQDVEHGVVGWKIVELPASDSHTRAFRETLPTVAEATTGFVNSCWVT